VLSEAWRHDFQRGDRMKSLETEDAKGLHLHRKEMYQEVDAYHHKFIDPETGDLDSRYVQERSCPLCESYHRRVLFKKNGGAYVICEDCDMVYLNPVFKDEELKKYYQQNNTAQAKAHESENEFYTAIYKEGLKGISKFVAHGSVLDIGCSSGLFLDIARKEEWQTYGIELNKVEYEIASRRRHVVWDCSVENLPHGLKFDVITMWDVLEHIKTSSTFLATIGSRLNAKGIIFLQVPNVASLAARILRDRCNMFDGIEHVNLYSPKTMRVLADQAGFEILSMETVIDELKVTKNYMAYQEPYFGDFRKSDDCGFLTPELVHQNLLGYKIQVVLRPVCLK